MLDGRDIRVELGGKTVLDDVSLRLAPGEVLAVLGPNGAGKSTLLSVLSGALRPRGGEASLDGRRVGHWSSLALARRRAVLPQHSALAFGFRVLQVALLGRSPHAGLSTRARDLAVVEAALEETEASHMADRVYTTLSGGERQRVQLARVLAQIDFTGTAPDGGRYLLLDEPTSSLDLAHQHATLRTARMAAERGVGVLAILHDLNLAAMYADRIVVLRDGRVVAQGTPDEVLTEAMVARAFDLAVKVTRHPIRDCPCVAAV